MRCLLVDDEPGIREGLAMLMRRRGHEVHTAADCASATAQLESGSFDVVVTDWRLPDGLAAKFLRQCRCPVIAVSGHPEEVVRSDAIRAVLPKPVMPARLLACIAEHAPLASVEFGAVSTCRDVQSVIDDVLAQLPADVVAECHDDGTFQVLRVRLPVGHVPMVRHLGGDLRYLADAQGAWLELRLCRDGRPEPDVAVARIDGPWPDLGRFALDCDGIVESADVFAGRLARVQARIDRGDSICLLNVPASLEQITTVWETTHDMPMRTTVGPRLPAELAELWS